MTITYTNANGESLTLRQRRPYFLQRVDGTGSIRNTINTFQASDQDGAFFISSAMEMRNITLEGTIVGGTVNQTFEARKRLLRVFAPKLKGTLVYRNAQISCIVEEANLIATDITKAPAFFISLLCPSPFFEALNDIGVELAAWLGWFSFPLQIPDETGIELGERQLSQIISVENTGDVPCGCTIIFTALSSLTNPELMNVETGEVLRLLKTMSAGEMITVYTHFANKRVVLSLGGEESNAFRYVDTTSTFLQLAPGTNTLRYYAEENMDALECRVAYQPLFLGI